MTIKFTLKTALTSLRANKVRSGLTILGIVIGIGAIMVIMSLGQGAQNLIVSQLQGLGSRTIIVIPGREPSGPTDPSVIETILSDSLGTRELDALRRKTNAPRVERVLPLVFGVQTTEYQGETFRPTILGATREVAEIFDATPSVGFMFDENDVKSNADVVVLGHRVKEELFGASTALGERIKIKGRNFRVIGVLPKKGQVSFFNFDESVLIPYTTAQRFVFGIKHFNRLIVEVDSERAVEQTVEDIQITLRNMHNITDPEKDDFFVVTQQGVIDQVTAIVGALTAFLSSVVAISLLVGGIGIMNIMLVSVTERTREIGLRKSLGATNKDILYQFLLEAVVLTGAGGLIGIILGAILSFAASVGLALYLGTDFTFSLPIFAAFLGLFVSFFVGVVFGLYPARQASKKSPMEALRYE